MEILLDIISTIFFIGAFFLIKSLSVMIGTKTLGWKESTWKNAFFYSLYITIFTVLGLFLTWLTTTYFAYPFFLIVIVWIWATIWIFRKIYRKDLLETLGGLFFYKTMELGVIALLFLIAFGFIASFVPEVTEPNNQSTNIEDFEQLENINLPQGLETPTDLK